MSEQVNLEDEIIKCENIISTMNNILKLMTDENTRTNYSNQISQLENHIQFMKGLAQQNDIVENQDSTQQTNGDADAK